ncbi:MAG: oxidoreductase-like domain-containing protein [Gammaproteobacteria bacterium]
MNRDSSPNSDTALGAADPDFPPPPARPAPGECCEGGCDLCVWVYYERAHERWIQQCEDIKARKAAVNPSDASASNDGLQGPR